MCPDDIRSKMFFDVLREGEGGSSVGRARNSWLGDREFYPRSGRSLPTGWVNDDDDDDDDDKDDEDDDGDDGSDNDDDNDDDDDDDDDGDDGDGGDYGDGDDGGDYGGDDG